MKTFIYTLIDPFTNEIRYVGKSNNPKKRLYDHLSLCYTTHTHKNNWIKSLLEKNTKPILDIIDEVSIDEWEFWEKYWIKKFKDDGENLTNYSKGGNGISKHGYNTIEKMKIRHKENPGYNRSGDNIKKEIDKELLYKLYIVENLSTTNIANKLKFGKKKIWDSLQEHGIYKDKEIWKEQLSIQPKKIVLQYSLEGELIKEWIGLDIIKRELDINKSNIANCCRGIVKTTGGYIWRYKDEFIEINLNKLNDKIRSVRQYDLSGNFIKEYSSIRETIKYGFNEGCVQSCCVGKSKSHNNYIWRYSEDKAPDKYKNKKIKPIIQYNMNMLFIKEWDSISSASKELGIGSNGITTCCKGKYKSAGGYIWKYKSDI